MIRYTKDEVQHQNDFIKAHYNKMPTKLIALRLGIPQGTVITRAGKLGISTKAPKRTRHEPPELKAKPERHTVSHSRPSTTFNGQTYDNDEDEEEIMRELRQDISLPKITMDR